MVGHSVKAVYMISFGSQKGGSSEPPQIPLPMGLNLLIVAELLMLIPTPTVIWQNYVPGKAVCAGVYNKAKVGEGGNLHNTMHTQCT